MHSMIFDVLGYLLWEQLGVGDRSCCLVWLILYLVSVDLA